MRALLDLVLPAACAGCGRTGRMVCDDCLGPLLAPPRVRRPSPAPPGLPAPHAVAAYAGATRRLVVAYKERDAVGLVRPLGDALAAALAAACADLPRQPVLVVPVPSTRTARRRRGYDPVHDLARRATARCRAAGLPLRLTPLLRHARAVRDSAGLTAVERAANLSHALEALPRGPSYAGLTAVVVDDVLTTGATLVEAARALRAVGVVPRAAAVVAATPRRAQMD